MSEHLKLARLKIEAACKMKPTDEHAVKLEEMLYCLLLHLEAQQETPASAEQPAPTESATRAENSAAVVHLALVSMETGAITPRIELLQRLLGALSPVERTLAAQESWLADPLVSFASRALMLVRDAELLTSTSRKQATSPSAATPSDDAASPSGSSSSYDMRPFLEADGCPDSPASSPEPAQGGSEAICAATGNERCLVAIGGGVPCADYIRCAALTPRTMKKGSERG